MQLLHQHRESPHRLQGDLEKEQGRAVGKQLIQHPPDAVIIQVFGLNPRSEQMLHRLARKEFTKQVKGRADEAQSIQNHRFQHLSWADVLQLVGFQKLIAQLHQTQLINDTRYQSQVV